MLEARQLQAGDIPTQAFPGQSQNTMYPIADATASALTMPVMLVEQAAGAGAALRTSVPRGMTSMRPSAINSTVQRRQPIRIYSARELERRAADPAAVKGTFYFYAGHTD
jgi:hypothetical protein